MRLHVQRLNNLPHHRPVQYTPPLSPYIYMLSLCIHSPTECFTMHACCCCFNITQQGLCDGCYRTYTSTALDFDTPHKSVHIYLTIPVPCLFLLSFIFIIVIIKKKSTTHMHLSFFQEPGSKLSYGLPFPCNWKSDSNGMAVRLRILIETSLASYLSLTLPTLLGLLGSMPCLAPFPRKLVCLQNWNCCKLLLHSFSFF